MSEQLLTTNYYFNHLPIDSGNDGDPSDHPVIIQTQWTDKKITISLVNLNGRNTADGYQGDLSLDKLQETAAMLEMPYKEFFEETKQALCTENGLKNFTYHWQDSKFTWRKITNSGAPAAAAGDSSNSVKIIYGSVQLIFCENLKTQILENSLKINGELLVAKQREHEQFMRFREDHEEFEKLLSRTIEEKNAIETNLLKKCAALLNEKKEKISRLELILRENKNSHNLKHDQDEDDDETDMEDSNEVPLLMNRNSKEKRPAATTVDSELDLVGRAVDDIAVLSQNDDQCSPVIKSFMPKRIKTVIQPSTSKHSSNSTDDLPVSRVQTKENNDIFDCDTQELFNNFN